jgi:DNA polymerase-1
LQTIDDIDVDYQLVDTPEKRRDLVQKLKEQQSFCFDTETTSLDAHHAELVGIAFSWSKHEAYYVPCPADRDETLKILADFRDVFEDEGIEKVGQNIKYDLVVLLHYGFHVRGPIFDTMIAHYLINPEMRHNMDILAETYLSYTPVSIEELIGKKGKNQGNMRDVDVEKVVRYAGEDADITWQLSEIFKPALEKVGEEDLYRNIEAPLIPILAEMEVAGVKLDREALDEIAVDLRQEIDETEKKIFELAGHEFNVGSPKQLGVVLFDEMKIVDKPKKTKSGQYSTSEDVLSKIEDAHDIVPLVLDYRSTTKLLSTYVEALPELVHAETGRIHTTFNQAVAATGRLSSTAPNLQNIPIRTERGRLIRKAFTSRGEDYIFMAADYSQIELRIVAALSGDESMIEAFKEGKDIHAATAAKVYDVALEDVTREMRSRAKMVNFGIIYGISAFGLADRLNIKRTEASEIINNYFEKYPKIKQYMDQSIEEARENGYVTTVMGRRRYLPDINSRNRTVRGFAERNAINAPIQGSAADIIKKAMIDIGNEMQKKDYQSKMVLQVHDELVFDMHRDEEAELTKMIVDKMENAYTMEVPLTVEVGTGANWLEAH